jgi:hypothetical protein
MRGGNLRQIAAEGEIPTFGPEPAVETSQPRAQSVATDAVFLALKALSQRALTALSDMADMALVGSAFVLWLLIIAQPTILQLVGSGAYALFIFATLLIRRRTR